MGGKAAELGIERTAILRDMTIALALSILAGLVTTWMITKLSQTKACAESGSRRFGWSLVVCGVCLALCVAVWVVAEAKLAG